MFNMLICMPIRAYRARARTRFAHTKKSAANRKVSVCELWRARASVSACVSVYAYVCRCMHAYVCRCMRMCVGVYGARDWRARSAYVLDFGSFQVNTRATKSMAPNTKDDSDSDGYSTDSDVDYGMDIDTASAIASATGLESVTTTAVCELYKSQRGICRITGLAFGEGLYAPVVSRRCVAAELGDSNSILVIDAVDKMRKSVSMPWRSFIQLLQSVSDSEL